MNKSHSLLINKIEELTLKSMLDRKTFKASRSYTESQFFEMVSRTIYVLCLKMQLLVIISPNKKLGFIFWLD